jgi:hypothetical protein
MTTSTNIKRLDEVEIQLTPKEWAIRLADEIRKYPNQDALVKAMAKVDPSEFPTYKAFTALAKQAEEKHPGNKDEDRRARYKYLRELRTEYHSLKLLSAKVNKSILDRAEKIGLEAALRISTLQTIILQDAFGRTARKAAGWIEVYETEGKDEEANRQVMLSELEAYKDVNFGAKASENLFIGDLRLRFPSPIENWVNAAVSLMKDLYCHQAAVQIVQDKLFDGHPILARDIEDRLKKTIQTAEDAALTFNDYLAVRGRLFKAEWEEEEEHEGGFVTAIPGEREGTLKIDPEKIKAAVGKDAKKVADDWVRDARDEAVYDMKEEAGEGDAAWMERFKRLAGVTS